MSKGTVIWFDRQKGYGFIRKSSGKEVFMHTKLVPFCKKIEPGDKVRFDMLPKSNGQLAIRVEKEPTEFRRVLKNCG
jgi:cold shock CspA family protein